MKAFVIKNENDYYYTLNEDEWDDEIYRAFITKDKKLAEEIAKEYNSHKKEDEVSCQAVPITIYEGDPLELACEETDNYWNEQKAFEKKMPLYDYFIQQAKEMKDE